MLLCTKLSNRSINSHFVPGSNMSLAGLMVLVLALVMWLLVALWVVNGTWIVIDTQGQDWHSGTLCVSYDSTLVPVSVDFFLDSLCGIQWLPRRAFIHCIAAVRKALKSICEYHYNQMEELEKKNRFAERYHKICNTSNFLLHWRPSFPVSLFQM